MDDEMIERCVNILMKHTYGLTKVGAAIVAVELITAMREPTEHMKRVGAMCMPDYDPNDDDAGRCWQDMINAIINE